MEAQSRYRPALILALSIWLAGGTCALAQVDFEGSGFTLENLKSYGNCAAATRVDMLTDEEHPVLYCERQEANFPPVLIFIFANQGGPLGIRLHVGEQFHSDNRIAVTLRIDKRPTVSRTAYWNRANQIAEVQDPDLARFLLGALATGMRVVLRVGIAQGHIKLYGSAAAIADFRSRIQP